MKTIISIKDRECNKIEAIKALREITGIGLKDAKDAVEDMMWNGKSYSYDLMLSIPAECHRNASNYFNMKEQAGSVKTALKRVIVEATKDEDFDLALDLIPIYRKHYSR